MLLGKTSHRRLRWWLYVPAGYDGKTPLALMVFQDGRDFVARDGTWRVPVALDNLIFRNELPLMVALFIDPGHAIRPTELASEQRSYEYDTLSDQYARFVITEMRGRSFRRMEVLSTFTASCLPAGWRQ